MENALKEKFETVVKHLDNAMIDPDIDITYYIPEVEMEAETYDGSGDPYILVKHNEDRYAERKICLSDKHMNNPPEDIANYVTFSIEQFKEEIKSLNYGAQ
jgi:hypothetical protein